MRGFRAVDYRSGWRSSCPRSGEHQRVSSSSCFGRADVGNWAERRPVVHGLVSRRHVDGVPASGRQRRRRACAPTTPATRTWSGPSRLSPKTVGASLLARTPRTLSWFFGSDSSPRKLTRAPAMGRGGGGCSKNDLSPSPSESKSPCRHRPARPGSRRRRNHTTGVLRVRIAQAKTNSDSV